MHKIDENSSGSLRIDGDPSERLLSEDIELAEQLVLKASIERGWQQVKTMEADDSAKGTLQDLIDELKKA